MNAGKSLLAPMLLVLCGCAADPTAARDPIPVREGAQRCLASGHDRNFCAQLASAKCGAGFEVFEMDAKDDDGVVRRGYHFRCLP
jgi:hypothetical protein